MSLAISFSCLLSFFFPFFVLAGPQTTIYLSPYPVPIPACAQDCLTKFIAQAFPKSVCADQQDLVCLCTHNSTTGFTIGEGALQCVAAYCPEELYKYAGVYEDCTGVANAQPGTHGTLTATMQTVPSEQPTSISSLPASIVNPTSIIPSSDTNTVTATPILPTSTPFPSTSSSSTSVTILLAPTPTSATQTFSSATTPGATSSTVVAPGSTPVLTKPQVAGIAVAGVASAALGFGLMLCILCLRKRHATRNRHSDASFGGDMIISRPSDPPDRPATTERNPRPGSRWLDRPVAGQRELLAVPPKAGELRWSKMWRGSLKPEEIGVAVAPGMHGSPVNDTTYSNSPVSAASSYRTTSRLLPDKPSMSSVSPYSLFPPPLRINHTNRPESDATVFEEDTLNGPRTSMRSSRQAGRGRGSIDMTPTPAQRTLYASASDPFLSPTTESRALVYAREQPRQSRRQFPLPPAHAPAPSRSYNNHWMPSPDELRAPPPVLVASHPSTNHSSKSLSLQRKPTGPSLRSAPPATAAFTAPTNLSSKSLPLHRKPTLAPIRPPLATIPSANSNRNSNSNRARTRPHTHLSTTSDTSFESGPYSPSLSDLSDLPYPSSSLFPPSSSNPEPFLSPVHEAEENSAPRKPPPAGTFADRSQHKSPISSIRYPPVPGAFASPHRPRPLLHPLSTETDTPTRKPRRKPVEPEGSPVYAKNTTPDVGVKASRSLSSLPTSPPDGGGGGEHGGRGVAGRKTAKLMILQNPGLAGLEGLHTSPARSVEDLRGRR